MPKMTLTCDYCNKVYSSYQCGKYNHFCSIECRRKGAHLMSDNISPEEKQRRTELIIKVNKTINNTPEKIERRRQVLLKDNGGYKKYYGRHEHRVIMEEYLGRELSPEEVVHHIDGNKQNNDISNLKLMTRSEHIREHLEAGGGRLCSNYIDTKN